MVFRLRDGPRDGQLVDELPRDYRALNLPDEPPLEPLFDDVVPTIADWHPNATPERPAHP
ncbi:hypothetical protein J2X03_003742 [Microbacterium trichothecenolyticum]|uniref:hypothetical protein n=1 Tax=Microbacterium trichothecenolyticum TaxID=69370 RepID=UPI00285A3B34|nr:hypothetical protein [Microbacterium trichothecenolyticum]MDR7113840.1 hypothetical protein [Microbacterium trichothecenolyticum]